MLSMGAGCDASDDRIPRDFRAPGQLRVILTLRLRKLRRRTSWQRLRATISLSTRETRATQRVVGERVRQTSRREKPDFRSRIRGAKRA